MVFFWEIKVCRFSQFWSFHGSCVQHAYVTFPTTYSSSGNSWCGIILAWLSTASILHTWIESIRCKLSTYLAWNIKISHWSKSRRAAEFSWSCFPLFKGVIFHQMSSLACMEADIWGSLPRHGNSKEKPGQLGEFRLWNCDESPAWGGFGVWNWCVSLCLLEAKRKSKLLRSLGSFKTNFIFWFLSSCGMTQKPSETSLSHHWWDPH